MERDSSLPRNGIRALVIGAALSSVVACNSSANAPRSAVAPKVSNAEPERKSEPAPPETPASSEAALPSAATEEVEDDRDHDGIADAKDACPDVAEDHQCLYEEGAPECCGALDGCPHPDPDQDGIRAEQDACPDTAEYWNGFEDDDGCPDARRIESANALAQAAKSAEEARRQLRQSAVTDSCEKGRVMIEGNEIVILENPGFVPGTAKLGPSAPAILDAVAATLRRNGILWVEVAGHVRRGGSKDPIALSFRRAQAVVEELVKRGVRRESLGPVGYGAYCPRSGDAGDDRVEFRLVATTDGPTAVERGCEKATEQGLAPPHLRVKAPAKP